jgi:chemotaxis protein methyltransferase CheR
MNKKSSTNNPSKKRTKAGKSESHLQQTQKIANIASWELDIKNGDLSWSDEVFNIFEIPQGTSLSYEGFLQAVLDEDREYVEQQWQAALDGEPYDIEHRIRAGKGIKWLREKADLEFDKTGRAVRGVGIVQDITTQKAAEQELRHAKINYRMIADFTYDWEWWKKPDGTFHYVSPACERITGYKAARFIENPSLLSEIIVPEDREKWEKHDHESHKDIGRREMQFRIKRPDGEVRWIEHACQPVFTRENEFLGFRGSNRDITERKKAELELKKSLAEINRLKDLHEKESLYLREEINLEHDYKNIIGNSNAIQYVLFKVEQVAETDSSVLILGETGTGKELIARAIHNNSQRKDRPLIKINCATLPANLIESELFGHERGSFTGAHAKHAGRFEVADGSSIFLDEIGELPIELQAKLLRVIEDGEFERLGSTKTLKVDVRIIAATNRDLEKDIQAERFRRDLWYRLNVFPITVPPLRDRLDDIPLIVQYYVDILARKLGRDIVSVPVKVVKTLQSYTWPGNVRELANVLERAVIGTSGSKLRLSDELKLDHQASPDSFKSLHDLERDYIVKVLEKTNWKVSGKNSAAEILALDRSTLRARMKKLGIHK